MSYGINHTFFLERLSVAEVSSIFTRKSIVLTIYYYAIHDNPEFQNSLQ